MHLSSPYATCPFREITTDGRTCAEHETPLTEHVALCAGACASPGRSFFSSLPPRSVPIAAAWREEAAHFFTGWLVWRWRHPLGRQAKNSTCRWPARRAARTCQARARRRLRAPRAGSPRASARPRPATRVRRFLLSAVKRGDTILTPTHFIPHNNITVLGGGLM